MNFREEYKNQAEVMSPSAEAVERMTRNIMEQVNAPAKKAVPFRKITYIGGAVAACAVIGLGIVKLLPTLTDSIPTEETASESYSTTVAADAEMRMNADGDYAYADNTVAEEAAAAPECDTNFEEDEAVDAFVAFTTEAELEQDKAAGLTGNAFNASEGIDTAVPSAPESAGLTEALPDVDEVAEEETVFDVTQEAAFAEPVIVDAADFEMAEDNSAFTLNGVQYFYVTVDYVSALEWSEVPVAEYVCNDTDGSCYDMLDWGVFVEVWVADAGDDSAHFGGNYIKDSLAIDR